jgi:hypothetical protein
VAAFVLTGLPAPGGGAANAVIALRPSIADVMRTVCRND